VNTKLRDKLLVFTVHFLATLALAACAAALIFLVWFPKPLATMIGGTELFLLVVGCDLVLGPLLSLVVYDRSKTRLALTVDYTAIAILQIGALLYGVLVVAGTRPVYIAFDGDRLEVVSARDIRPDELAAARDPRYASLGFTGPRFVAVMVPKNEQQDAMFAALAGNEEHQRPKFYAPYESALDSIRGHARPLAVLAAKSPAVAASLDAATRGLLVPVQRLRWLPVHHRLGFWTALIDVDAGRPVAYVDQDPY
jgi:hypothetical protein